MKFTKTFVSLVFTALLASCGGGGGGGGGSSPSLSVGSLAGTWYGTLEDINSVMHTVSLTIGSGGSISQIINDGSITSLTGTITQSSTHVQLFSATFSDGTIVGFFADSSAGHIAFVDNSTNVGVLQKSASSLPGYTASDIAGTWSGYTVDLDSSMNVLETYTSGATVSNNASYSFSGSNKYGSFSGSFPTVNTYYGRWRGTFTQASVTGTTRAFMSPDKKFSMSWACPSTTSNFLRDCSFAAWAK